MDFVMAIRMKQQEMLQKYGFYFHYVFNDDKVDIHTHGLEQNFDSRELQIVIDIGQDAAGEILFNIVENIIKNGTVCENMPYHSIINNYPIKLKKIANPNGQTVLRVVFPDKDGKFPDDEGCDPIFAMQHEPFNL